MKKDELIRLVRNISISGIFGILAMYAYEMWIGVTAFFMIGDSNSLHLPFRVDEWGYSVSGVVALIVFIGVMGLIYFHRKAPGPTEKPPSTAVAGVLFAILAFLVIRNVEATLAFNREASQNETFMQLGQSTHKITNFTITPDVANNNLITSMTTDGPRAQEYDVNITVFFDKKNAYTWRGEWNLPAGTTVQTVNLPLHEVVSGLNQVGLLRYPKQFQDFSAIQVKLLPKGIPNEYVPPAFGESVTGLNLDVTFLNDGNTAKVFSIKDVRIPANY